MYIQLANKSLHVKFQHVKEDSAQMEEYREQNKRVPFKRFTVCTISDPETKDVLCFGQAFCSKKDQFNRAYGRKSAFSRAVGKFTANDEERIHMYQAYNKATGQHVFHVADPIEDTLE